MPKISLQDAMQKHESGSHSNSKQAALARNQQQQLERQSSNEHHHNQQQHASTSSSSTALPSLRASISSISGALLHSKLLSSSQKSSNHHSQQQQQVPVKITTTCESPLRRTVDAGQVLGGSSNCKQMSIDTTTLNCSQIGSGDSGCGLSAPSLASPGAISMPDDALRALHSGRRLSQLFLPQSGVSRSAASCDAAHPLELTVPAHLLALYSNACASQAAAAAAGCANSRSSWADISLLSAAGQFGTSARQSTDSGYMVPLGARHSFDARK